MICNPDGRPSAIGPIGTDIARRAEQVPCGRIGPRHHRPEVIGEPRRGKADRGRDDHVALD